MLGFLKLQTVDFPLIAPTNYGNGRENCFFKGDLAYTEDDVLVYNIFAYNIPEETNAEEICERFSTFGEIRSVRFVVNTNRDDAPKIAAINYENAASAASVLRCFLKTGATPMVIKSNMILAQPAESWQQPHAVVVHNETSPNDNADEANVQQNQSLNLTMLNDDCLACIFKKLELKDQIRLARSCQRMKDVFNMICKSEHKSHKMDDLASLTLWEIRDFFLLAGEYIQEFVGSPPFSCRDRDIYAFVGKCCTNLRRIYFDSSRALFRIDTTCGFFKLLENLEHCTDLELRNCSLQDEDILVLGQLPNLRSLSVPENDDLTGNNIEQLTRLTDLCLGWCGNIQPSAFSVVIQALTELKSVDILECVNLKSSCLRKLTDYNSKLESVKMSSMSEPYDFIAHLPNLKKLELLWFVTPTTYIDLQFFGELAEQKAQQLEWLKVQGICIEKCGSIARLTNLKHLICENVEHLTDECFQIFGNLKNLEVIELKHCLFTSNEGVIQLVGSCTNLRKVVMYDCVGLEDQNVVNLIPVLKATYMQRKQQRVSFHFTKTAIGSYMKNNKAFRAAEEYLKLYFHFAAIGKLKCTPCDISNVYECSEQYDLTCRL